jgi:iron(III) transport system permease protein
VADLFRVVLPQLRLAICGGALLVALHLLAEFGLFAMVRFDTFTTAIYDQFQSTFSGPAANMLAGVLALCCLASCCWKGRRGGKRAMPASVRAPRASSSGSRWAGWRDPLQLALLTLVMLALGVPLMVLCRWLWLGGVENWLNADLWLSLRQTLLLGAVGALLTTACAIPIAWLGVRYPQRLFDCWRV